MILAISGFWFFDTYYDSSNASEQRTVSIDKLPFEFWPESTTGAIVKHQFYTLSYSEAYEQAEWVFYGLSKDQLTQDQRKRPYFIEDPKVETNSADWRNYKGSGYDRGHLCPAGDRRFSEQAYNETFYTSNISPQRKDFNAGVWNRLEQQVRKWAKQHEKVYVITGGILQENLTTIGKESVAVPRYFYKIVVRQDTEGPEVLAFLMKHEESSFPLERFLISVDSLEQLSGIDFFLEMPDDIEAALEKGANKGDWKF